MTIIEAVMWASLIVTVLSVAGIIINCERAERIWRDYNREREAKR